MKASICTAALLLAAPTLLAAQGLEARVKALEEKVAMLQSPLLAVYINSGPVNVPNGNDPEIAVLPLNQKVLDQKGAVTVGPPWRFTAPIAGTYRFDFQATLPNDNVATSPYFRCDIFVVKGSAAPVRARTNWAYDVDCEVSTILQLGKGDQVFTKVAQASGHQRTLSLAQFVGTFIGQ